MLRIRKNFVIQMFHKKTLHYENNFVLNIVGFFFAMYQNYGRLLLKEFMVIMERQ